MYIALDEKGWKAREEEYRGRRVKTEEEAPEDKNGKRQVSTLRGALRR